MGYNIISMHKIIISMTASLLVQSTNVSSCEKRDHFGLKFVFVVCSLQDLVTVYGAYKNDYCTTGPKVRFPLCRAYQNMSFPTHVCQRIGQSFYKINERCRKFCPILHISYMHDD